MCFRLLQMLQLHLLGGLCRTDSRTRLQQLQTLAHLLQGLEEMLRFETLLHAAKTSFGYAVDSTTTESCSLSFSLVKSALALLGKTAVPAAVATVQGQQLLQAGTSLLLTCSSLLHAKQHMPTVPELAVCVELLGLLQAAQQPGVSTSGSAAVSWVEAGTTQSAAAGAALVGRYLVAIGDKLTPSAAERSSSTGAVPAAAAEAAGAAGGAAGAGGMFVSGCNRLCLAGWTQRLQLPMLLSWQKPSGCLTPSMAAGWCWDRQVNLCLAAVNTNQLLSLQKGRTCMQQWTSL
jgi:hypothetical protein